jgi:hypothetical protein
VGTLETLCPYVPRAKGDFHPFVYGLVDPAEPGHVRYVGLAGSAAGRPYDHVKRMDKPKFRHLYVSNWIRSMAAEGRDPSVLLLEELSEGTSRKLLCFVEMSYISSLAKIGHRLTNLTTGGDGCGTGPKTPEHRARIGKANTGRPVSAASRAKQSRSIGAWYAHPENRKRVSDSHNRRLAEVGSTKFTEAQVLAIRADPRMIPAIAKAYGVSDSSIALIKSRETWSYLDGPPSVYAKQAAWNKGVPPTAEAKAAQALAVERYWQDSDHRVAHGNVLRESWRKRKAANALLTPRERAQKKLDKLLAQIAKLKTEMGNG